LIHPWYPYKGKVARLKVGFSLNADIFSPSHIAREYMTSWIQTRMKRKEEGPVKPRPYFLELDDEPCSKFNHLFYSYMYAKSNKRDLFLFDKANVGNRLEDTFGLLPDLTYCSEMKPSVSVLRTRDFARFGPLFSSMSVENIRTSANEVLVWKDAAKAKIVLTLQSNEIEDGTAHDIGIHIERPGRGRVIMQPYIDAVRAVSKAVSTVEPTIFVMCDEPSYFDEFKRLADKTWNLKFIRKTTVGSRVPSRTIVYQEFLAELYCMQTCSNLVCNLSNDVGRFLFLTAAAKSFRSLGAPTWAPL
jgi:hypothetical protein